MVESSPEPSDCLVLQKYTIFSAQYSRFSRASYTRVLYVLSWHLLLFTNTAHVRHEVSQSGRSRMNAESCDRIAMAIECPSSLDVTFYSMRVSEHSDGESKLS